VNGISRFRNEVPTTFVTAERRITLKRRNVKRMHKHTTVTTRAIRQRSGIPYEVERKICKSCSRLLEEKPVKRASAA
jgi:NMD protein affecting ribosome stability and mRNA decay